MRFSLAATLACASAAIAAPAPCPAPSGEQVSTTSKTFGVMCIRSGDPVHYASWGASLNELGAGLQQQNASCDAGVNATSATFYINDGALWLYTNGAPWQEVWVDRSGMGMGNMGYTTGAQPPPTNSERKGWSIDENDHLLFGGNSFLACPAKDGYSLWAATGTDTPGWNKDCVGIAARVVPIDKPVGCQYTQYP
ncbi:hypothetical protein KEM56_003828 [Ascosphaera pollenicola]|nr:hypothetical protein KEM56_003828 [Ascosphaera pollenicola]